VHRNEVVFDGRLLKRGALRHTPAGIPAIDVLIGHSSMQTEAGERRKTQFEINATAIGEDALKLVTVKLNQSRRFSGFLTRRSVSDSRLMLHVTGLETVGGGEQE
jgi:primosomal replication protein N